MLHTHSVLSVLFAPAVVLASALLVHASARAFAALSRALRGRPPRPRDAQAASDAPSRVIAGARR